MNQFVFKNQAQDMQYEFQWLPSYMFKKFCGGERKYNVINKQSKPSYVSYPNIFRDMWLEDKKNRAIFE